MAAKKIVKELTLAEKDTLARLAKVHEELKAIRKRDDLSFKQPSPYLRTHTLDSKGNESPLKLRYYQVQGIYHLLAMKRMLLGDAAGTGKTLQVLGTLAYLWSKEIDNKAIIVTPKSALLQWAGEIQKFTKGIRPIVARGTAEERKKAYLDFLNAPTGPDAEKVVLLVNYSILVRDWDVGANRPLLPNGKPDPKAPVSPGLLDGITSSIKQLCVVYDECFDYFTPILLANGKTEIIGKIVCQKQPLEVLSYNWETGKVEAKKITNWFRKKLGVNHGTPNHMLKVTFKFGGYVTVTKSHEFYDTLGQKKKARDFKPGSQVATLDTNAPSVDQTQVILGALLGDSSVSLSKNIWGINFGHAKNQEAYLKFKRAIFESIGVSEINYTRTEWQTEDQHMARFKVSGSPSITRLIQENGILSEGKKSDEKKTLTVEWLNLIQPLGLAIWYGDDGAFDHHSKAISFHTEGFSKEGNELLAGWLLWRWGVRALVKPAKDKYWYLYLPREEAAKFLSLLPGCLPGLEYKWPTPTKLIALEELNLAPQTTLVNDTVVSVEKRSFSAKREKYVYDFEVEDNHNYFANGVLVSNCHTFKSTSTKTWQTCRFLADKAHRCYGMTATLLKNRLEEGFSIYKVIVPDLFRNKTSFMDDYCVVRLQSVGGGRKIPMVVGYRNLEQFRARIDPFYLGRQKHEISSELPKLVTKEIMCELSAAEDKKYAEALTGILELGDGEVKDYEQNKALTALIYCQQVVNSLSLLKFKGGDELGNEHYEDTVAVKEQSSKETALLDLLTEELDDEKVIVYTRFASLIPRLQELLKKQKVKSVAITGKVKDTDRRKAQEAFQDLESDTKVVFITDAGAESINLQAASAIVFFDAPWSWGNYVQLLGRPIRIGSIHTTVLAYHLIAVRPAQRAKDRKTIDQHTLDTLRSKKDLVDKILGEAAIGALDFSSKDDGPLAVLKAMQAEISGSSMEMKTAKKEPIAKPKRMADDLDDLDAILSSAATADKT